jgi:hypothetical protein
MEAARYKKAKAQTLGESAGHRLATTPVGPQGQRHGPQQLGHLGHEGHRTERGVGHVERHLEVVADERDAVAEGPRDKGGPRHQDQRGVPRRTQDAEERRRLALTGAGHDAQVGHHVRVPGLRHRVAQEVLGNGEVEEWRVGHWAEL